MSTTIEKRRTALVVDPRIRILFATGYVDHILFFFLRDLAVHADVLVLFQAENEWTRVLGEHGVRAVVRRSISGAGRGPVP